MKKEHQWKLSWPGNFCLKCGMDDPIELACAGIGDAMIDCPHQSEPEAFDCKACGGTGLRSNPNFEMPECID